MRLPGDLLNIHKQWSYSEIIMCLAKYKGEVNVSEEIVSRKDLACVLPLSVKYLLPCVADYLLDYNSKIKLVETALQISFKKTTGAV